jgi:hypothetical protein
MILLEESLIIAVANAEVPFIATSKLALIITKGGGSQREEVKPYHSKLKCAYPQRIIAVSKPLRELESQHHGSIYS